MFGLNARGYPLPWAADSAPRRSARDEQERGERLDKFIDLLDGLSEEDGREAMDRMIRRLGHDRARRAMDRLRARDGESEAERREREAERRALGHGFTTQEELDRDRNEDRRSGAHDALPSYGAAVREVRAACGNLAFDTARGDTERQIVESIYAIGMKSMGYDRAPPRGSYCSAFRQAAAGHALDAEASFVRLLGPGARRVTSGLAAINDLSWGR